MKQRIILFGLILVGTVTFAQSPEEKGLNTINRSSAEATIGFLASDELQGREAGFHGSYVSSEYIASIFAQRYAKEYKYKINRCLMF